MDGVTLHVLTHKRTGKKIAVTKQVLDLMHKQDLSVIAYIVDYNTTDQTINTLDYVGITIFNDEYSSISSKSVIFLHRSIVWTYIKDQFHNWTHYIINSMCSLYDFGKTSNSIIDELNDGEQ